MTYTPELDKVKNELVTKLRAIIEKARTERALGTVEVATSCLCIALDMYERIKRDTSYDDDIDKSAMFVGYVTNKVDAHISRYGFTHVGLYNRDTFPNTFNTGDILEYKRPPGQA